MPKKAIDLSGQQFGELTVIERDITKPTGNGCHAYWICECSCGKVISVPASRLRQKGQKSCGHLRLSKRDSLIGQKFGYLIVLDYDFSLKDVDGKYYYKCQCQCGEIVSRAYSSLVCSKFSCCYNCKKILFPNTSFSGLSEEEEIKRIGQRFGKLVIVKATEKRYRNGEKYYLCQCDCGNTTLARWSSLITGGKNSCGCLESKGEFKIKSILKEHNISFEKQYSFDDLVSSKGRKLKFDFAIFEKDKLKCLIEYQGEQHYREESRFYNEEAQERDSLKREYCFKNNINLIEIPYTDYNKIDYNYLLNLGV